ncbi:MAG: aminotransferase class IV [Flavobacteriales bacterium]|nr:MAG: aminotransferase class IV [Flavobacteriales bacterium]
MESIFFYNGEFLQNDQLTLPLTDRALRYGDGVFETLKYAKNELHWVEDHYFRLMSNMRIMRMEIPDFLTPEFFRDTLLELVQSNHRENDAVRLRFQAWRTDGGNYRPLSNEVNLMATAEVLVDQDYTPRSGDFRIDIFKDYHKPRSLLSNVKSCNAQLYVLASVFAAENQLDECLLINDEKNIVEAISSNVMLINGKTLTTPPLTSGCLKGIMRKRIVEKLAPYLGFQVEEKDFNPFALLKADEIWLTNSITGIQPVTHYRKRELATTEAQRMIEMINAQFG